MKIINDTEVFEPNECFFAVESDPDDPAYTIVSITGQEFWKENHCLDDGFGDHSLTDEVGDELCASGISNEMEATWCSEYSVDEVRKIMVKLGFVENDGMRMQAPEENPGQQIAELETEEGQQYLKAELRAKMRKDENGRAEIVDDKGDVYGKQG